MSPLDRRAGWRAWPESVGRWLAAWVLLVGVLLGSGYADSYGRYLSNWSPEGWSRSALGVPFRADRVLGWSALSSQRWSLDHQQSLISSRPASSLSLSATIPAHGSLWIQPAAPPEQLRPAQHSSGGFGDPLPLAKAPALRLQRGAEGEPGRAQALLREGDDWRPLDCEGSLSPPGEQPYQLSLSWTGDQLLAETAAGQLRCGLRLDSQLGVPVLRAGLRRVQLEDLTLDGRAQGAPLSRAWLALGGGLGALLALGLTLLERQLGASRRYCALSWSPALLTPWLMDLNWISLAELLRSLALTSELAGVQVALALCALVKLSGALVASLRAPGLSARTHSALLLVSLLLLALLTRGGALSALSTGLSLGLLYALTGWCMGRLRGDPARLLHPQLAPLLLLWLGLAAWTWQAQAAASLRAGLYLFAALLLVLLWMNLHASRVSAVNPLSLGAALLVLLSLEMGLQGSEGAERWRQQQSRLGELESVQQLQGMRGPSRDDIPMPERYPPAGQRSRLVCMGGSSTAGALGQRNRALYYPARLAERQGGSWEVLNLGAAGWTSHHIRRYLELELASLQPDLLVLYTAYNDRFIELPMSLAQLETRTQAGAERGLLSLLQQSALLRSFSQTVLGLTRWLGLMSADSAVSPAELEQNLRAIHTLLQTQGGAELVLLREVSWPEPWLLDPYAAVMSSLAEELPGLHYLDPAPTLMRGGEQLFIDDVHLTEEGHLQLAAWLDQELRSRGLLEPR